MTAASLFQFGDAVLRTPHEAHSNADGDGVDDWFFQSPPLSHQTMSLQFASPSLRGTPLAVSCNLKRRWLPTLPSTNSNFVSKTRASAVVSGSPADNATPIGQRRALSRRRHAPHVGRWNRLLHGKANADDRLTIFTTRARREHAESVWARMTALDTLRLRSAL